MSDRVVLQPHVKDLGGGFSVRRLLPAQARRAVGPFLFFDHFGPVEAGPDDQHDVRPHPHIGLATVTYLFEGAMLHRDSTGAVQRIEPGAINWMTAGRGIVHSERTPEDLRSRKRRTHGLQLWVGLPAADEESAPAFFHTPAASLPEVTLGAAGANRARVLVGPAFGQRSPVPARSPTVFLDLVLAPGEPLRLGPDDTPGAAERALYALTDPLQVDGVELPAQHMLVLPAGHTVELTAPGAARVVLIGGEPLGHRHLYWNFVSSRRERLRQAADDWASGRFPAVPGESEFIPLPEQRPL